MAPPPAGEIPADVTLPGFTAALRARGVDDTHFAVDEKGTLAAPPPPRPGALAVFDQGRIAIGELLARGGMGDVLLAEQASLRRRVAVKRVRKDQLDPAIRDELIAEARVAGFLEHPNIVPIHLLSESSGEPLLVMKHIVGRTWAAVLRDDGRDEARDLAILMDVCRAIQFAHERGVVHRDLKPANVMVGENGEVYVVDWGIAVATRDDAPAELPRTKSGVPMAGTPSYMAPEMAVPEGVIDERTDVYLLGAVLHELIVGRPPHQHPKTTEALHAAWRSAVPVFPAHVPEELAVICRRAMARAPQDRFPDVAAFRDAVVRYQATAGARALCAEADVLLEALRALPKDVDAREAMRLFDEARFGYAFARRAAPESARAARGLQETLEVMIRRELAADRVESARLLVGELGDAVPDDIVAALRRLDAERARQANSVIAFERMQHEGDVALVQDARARGLLVLSALWLLGAIGLQAAQSTGLASPAHGTFIAAMLGSCVFVAVTPLVSRRVGENRASRDAWWAVAVGGLSQLSLALIGGWAAMPMPQLLACSHVLLASGLGARTIIEPRMWPAILCAVLGAPAVLAVGVPFMWIASGTSIALALAASASVAFVPPLGSAPTKPGKPTKTSTTSATPQG